MQLVAFYWQQNLLITQFSVALIDFELGQKVEWFLKAVDIQCCGTRVNYILDPFPCTEMVNLVKV